VVSLLITFRDILTLLLLIVPLILLHQEDEDLPEDLDKVNEEVQGVCNEVPITIASLPDDDLGVEHDEAAEDSQTNVKMCLEQKLGPEEDISEPEDEKGREARHEGATEIEILAIWSKEGSSSKASKDRGCDHEGRGHQGGVHHDCHLQERAQTKTSQEGKSKQHPHAHAAVLSIVWGHKQTQSKTCSEEGEHDSSSLKEGGEQVHVGPGSGGHHGHSEAGVDILQVGANISIKFSVERVEEIVDSCCHLDSLLLL